MKFKIRSFLLTTIMLLMGMHFQSNVFAHSDHDKDANVIKIADIVILSLIHISEPTRPY